MSFQRFVHRIGIKESLKSLSDPAIPSHLTKRYKHLDQQGLAAIASVLKHRYFTDKVPDYFTTEQGAIDLQAHLSVRLGIARKQIVPWIDHTRPLAGARILEVGCGTGSDTVAFTEQGADVVAVDVDEQSLAVAKERCAIYGVKATFIKANAIELDHLLDGERFDIIIFYASLEHMTHHERMAAMSGSWRMLSSGALWCIVETPNRLWYYDSHTSLLPFFLWLPDDLAFKYARFSPRPYFRELYGEDSENEMIDFLRRGRGMSFHEFELTMQKAENLDVVSCKSIFFRQRNKLRWLQWRVSLEYRYESFLAKLCPYIHRGFFQPYLDLIIRKH